MNVPSHMEITASLMAGYRFDDGSLLEVDSNGDYRITDENGNVLAETVDSQPGEFAGIHSNARGYAGPPPAEDYGDIMDDLAVFLCHDADLYDATRTDSDDAFEEFMFSWTVGAWANAHHDELSILACYREDREQGEGFFAEEE